MKKYLSLLLFGTLLYFPKNANALLGLSPLGFLMKPYVGIEYIQPDLRNVSEKQMSNPLKDVTSNYGLFAGVRIHKYFGVEIDYQESKQYADINRALMPTIQSGQYKMSMNSQNFMLYLPILHTLELYSSMGIASYNISSSTTSTGGISSIDYSAHQQFKYGFGVQFNLLGRLAGRWVLTE